MSSTEPASDVSVENERQALVNLIAPASSGADLTNLGELDVSALPPIQPSPGGTKQLPNGAARLSTDAAGGTTQMSDAWVTAVLQNLDPESEAFKAVTAARDEGTLVKIVVGVNRLTGNLTAVRIQ